MAQCNICGFSAGLQAIHPECEKLAQKIGVDAAQRATRLNFNKSLTKSVISSGGVLVTLTGLAFPVIVLASGYGMCRVFIGPTDSGAVIVYFLVGCIIGLLPASILLVAMKIFARLAQVITLHLEKSRVPEMGIDK